MSTEKRSRMELVRRWIESSTVIRPRLSAATAARPCRKAACSGDDRAADVCHHRPGCRDHVDREALAHGAGEALDRVEHGDQAAIVGGDGGEAMLEGGVLRRRQ